MSADDTASGRDSAAIPENAATAVRGVRPGDEEATRLAGTRTARSASAHAGQPGTGATLQPGTCLRGRYVLEAQIGQGAMGQVWKARDLLSEEACERNPYIAIKVLLAGIEKHPQSFAAMHREASRTQKLAHPNIVTVYTLDRDDDTGRAFIAMELLEGAPLDQIIRRNRNRPIAAKQMWPIISGLAEGLAYAHRKGIVHSDFKPGNVFLTREGVAKILDFGIARAARYGEGGAAVRDDDSVVSGYTETYAAPEVLSGEPPHTADDVFALGLVSYELLTGEHPFGRRPASEASAANLRPRRIKGIARGQWRTIEKALAFGRAQRWPDAGKFLESLQRRIRLQVALAASLMALLVTAGGLSHRNHLDNLPAVAFEQLPPETRAAVTRALEQGNEALRYVRESDLIEASADAADRFAEVYALHPRNPDAVRGLEASADYFIAWWQRSPDRERALAELRKFQQKSEYYRGYAPLRRAIGRLEAGD